MSFLSGWNALKNRQEEEGRAEIRKKLEGSRMIPQERKRLQDILDRVPPKKIKKKDI